MLNLTIIIPPKVPNSADTPKKLNEPTRVNLTTLADQFQPKKHTYQTKHTDRCWT